MTKWLAYLFVVGLSIYAFPLLSLRRTTSMTAMRLQGAGQVENYIGTTFIRACCNFVIFNNFKLRP